MAGAAQPCEQDAAISTAKGEPWLHPQYLQLNKYEALVRQRNAECPSIPANEVCMNEQNVLASLAPIQLQGSYSTTPMAAHWEGPQPRCRPGPAHTCVSLLGRIFPGPSSLPTVMSDLRHVTAVLQKLGQQRPPELKSLPRTESRGVQAVLIHVYIVIVLNTHSEILKQIVTCHL